MGMHILINLFKPAGIASGVIPDIKVKLIK
jgi:hypothetical protein